MKARGMQHCWGTVLLAALCAAAQGCAEEAPLAFVKTIEIFEDSADRELSPAFDHVLLYTATVWDRERNAPYPADIYFPDPAELIARNEILPGVWLVQEGNVDPADYRQFASRVASYGFLVVVPDHPAMFGNFAKVLGVNSVLDFMQTENEDVGSPLAGLIDVDTVLAIGHGFGGAVAIQAVEGKCEFPFCCCLRTFERPPELRGAVAYGADLRHIDLENIDYVEGPTFLGGPVPAVENSGKPVAMIRGTLDSLASLEAVRETFDQIQDPPKAMIEIAGANHYSITDDGSPAGAIPDDNRPHLDQQVAIDTIARCCAAFLRAFVLAEARATEYLAAAGADPDGVVTVEVVYE